MEKLSQMEVIEKSFEVCDHNKSPLMTLFRVRVEYPAGRLPDSFISEIREEVEAIFYQAFLGLSEGIQ